MNAEFSGPCPGDKVLLISAEQDAEMFDLLRLVFEQKGYLTLVSTVVEAINKLTDPFDLVWLHLPLPDLYAHLFLDRLLATPDLTHRVGVADPQQACFRLLDMPGLKAFRSQNKHGIWVRVRTEDERNGVRRLLEQCARK